MPERSTKPEFRSHHAPMQAFQILHLLGKLTRERLVWEFSLSSDWAKSPPRAALLQLLAKNPLRNRLSGYLAMLNKPRDGYLTDLLGNDRSPTAERKKVEAFIQAEEEGLRTLFLADPGQQITVGSILDNVCNLCNGKVHCREPQASNGDSSTAKNIHGVCTLLGIACCLSDSPDNIYELDENGTLTKTKVAVLALGDFRDYLLRRLIFAQERFNELTLKCQDSLRGLAYSQLPEEEKDKLVDLQNERLFLAAGNLFMINRYITPEDEVALHQRIVETRD